MDEMNDPARWNKDPLRPPAAADVLLRCVRRPRPPGADDLARLGSLVAQIPRRSALAARRRSRFVVAAAAAIVVASLGTAVWALHGRVPMSPAAPVVAAAETVGSLLRATPPRVAPPLAEPADVTGPKPVARRPSVGPVAAHRGRPPRAVGPEPEVDTLVSEIAFIDAARADVDVAPIRALAALDRHRREFPRGQLSAEREFLAVEALRRVDRTDEARRRADALRISYPSSSYAARASRLLQSER